jgi:hypothetical protein
VCSAKDILGSLQMTPMTSELSAIFACAGVWRKSGWVMGDSIKWLRERLSGLDSPTVFKAASVL